MTLPIPVLRCMLVALVLAGGIPARAGVHSPIIGGNRVVGQRWSCVVALTYQSRNGYRCQGSGVLVAPDIVLTAAHCIDPVADPTTIRIHVGNGKDGARFKGQFGVREVMTHPFYRLKAYELAGGGIRPDANDTFDFALMRLDRPVPALFAKPAAVLSGDDDVRSSLRAGRQMVIVGFGRREAVRGTNKIGFKNELSLEVDKVRGRTEVDFRAQYDRNSLPGDSGGGAFVRIGDRWKLAGICSRGNNKTATYGLVPFALPWLQWESGVDFGLDVRRYIGREFANERFQRARYFLDRGRISQAETAVRKVLLITPDNPEAHDLLALVALEAAKKGERLLKTGDPLAVAVKHGRRASELDPASFIGTYARALLARNDKGLNDLALARDKIEQALQLDPQNRQFNDIRDRILKLSGENNGKPPLLSSADRADSKLAPRSTFDTSLSTYQAIRRGDVDALRLLLKRGAYPAGLQTAIELGCSRKGIQVVRLLLLNRTGWRFADSKWRDLANSFWAAKRTDLPRVELARELLERGIDPDHLVARVGQMDKPDSSLTAVVAACIEYGLDVDLKVGYRNEPLLAVLARKELKHGFEAEWWRAMAVLLANGANPHGPAARVLGNGKVTGRGLRASRRRYYYRKMMAAYKKPKSSLGAATKLLKTGQFDQAIAMYERVLMKHPRNFKALYRMHVGHLYAGQRAAARAGFERIADQVPHLRGKALYNLACLDSLDGKLKRAEGHLRQAIEAGYCYVSDIMQDSDLESLRKAGGVDRILQTGRHRLVDGKLGVRLGNTLSNRASPARVVSVTVADSEGLRRGDLIVAIGERRPISPYVVSAVKPLVGSSDRWLLVRRGTRWIRMRIVK